MDKINIFESSINKNWQWVVGGLVVIAIIFLWYFRVDKFISAQVDSKLPYSSGSNIRVLSTDSSTSRGVNNTWENLINN